MKKFKLVSSCTRCLQVENAWPDLSQIFFESGNDADKDWFDRGHNPSYSTLYPDVLKIKKNNYCETKICKNATCLLLTNP